MNNWTTLISFTYPHEAHMAKGLLESEEFNVHLKDELTVQSYHFYSNAIGGVKVQVLSADLEKAKDILRNQDYTEFQKSKASKDMETFALPKDGNNTNCPYCISENTWKNKQPNLLSIIGVFILGFFFPTYKVGYKCYDCSEEWKFKKV